MGFRHVPDRSTLADANESQDLRIWADNLASLWIRKARKRYLHMNNWQVELFVQWLQQHLRIKKFVGASENAVRTQIWCAVPPTCSMSSKRSCN